VVGDFDRDGNLDIATVGFARNNGYITILLGNGDGTFHPGRSFEVGVQTQFIATASLGNNGILDLVVGDTLFNHAYVLLGNGDGTFQPAVAYPVPGRTETIGIGDFTGDGIPDIVAITGYTCYCLNVLPGKGDGTFGAPIMTPVPAPNYGYYLVSGDFNGDGKLDLAITTWSEVYILLGNGDGTFQKFHSYPIPPYPFAIAAGDFRNDGRTDLAIGDYEGEVLLLLGNGNGTFQGGDTYPVYNAVDVAVGDLNNNGNQDIAISNLGSFNNQNSSTITVLWGEGNGHFQPALFPAGDELIAVAIGDFNNDGLPDLIALDFRSAIITLLNTGVVSFSPTSPLAFATQLINTTSSPLAVTLTNNGTSALTISSISYTGKPFHVENNCPASVASGGSCVFTATYLPTSPGVDSGSITINDSASSKPQVILLQGTATQINVQPTQLTFPPQKVGTQSPYQEVKVTNVGSSPVDLTSISVFQYERNFFESNNCPTSLSAGASCSVHVVFAPRSKGTLTSTLDVVDNGGGSPQLVYLTGTGD
jgi:hypothetical protein